MSRLKRFSTCFPQVGSAFSAHLAVSSLPHHHSFRYARLKVSCVPLSANTFLLAPPYLSRRDALSAFIATIDQNPHGQRAYEFPARIHAVPVASVLSGRAESHQCWYGG